MRRTLFNLATAVSLALCVATAAMWMRSHTVYDLWEYQTAGAKLYSAHSVHGDLFLNDVDRAASRSFPAGFSHVSHPPATKWVSWKHVSPTPADSWRLMGVGIVRGGYFRKLVIAYWLIMICLSLLPAYWLRDRRRNRQREAAGLCPSCGYDLRATPDRCPECGAVASS